MICKISCLTHDIELDFLCSVPLLHACYKLKMVAKSDNGPVVKAQIKHDGSSCLHFGQVLIRIVSAQIP